MGVAKVKRKGFLQSVDAKLTREFGRKSLTRSGTLTDAAMPLPATPPFASAQLRCLAFAPKVLTEVQSYASYGRSLSRPPFKSNREMGAGEPSGRDAMIVNRSILGANIMHISDGVSMEDISPI